MYGVKRLTIDKRGMIAIKGNGDYNPIGRCFAVNGRIIGKLRKLNPEFDFETTLTEYNSIDFDLDNIVSLRKYVKSIYINKLMK